MEEASRVSGLSIETLEAVARHIATPSGCACSGRWRDPAQPGSDTSTAISNLLLVTGNYMRPGTGAYPLRGHNNVQGASDHGSMPNNLPGYQSVDDPNVRARFEAAWKVSLPTAKGLDNHQMVDAIHQGKLKAMYLIGEEMSIVDSNANYVSAAFEKLGFFVVQDVFFSHTCQFADVVLPASPSLEKEGTFTSTERRIQRLYQVFEPLEGSRPDWRIIQDVANHLGASWSYQHPSQVMDEIASLTPLFAGVSYQRLEGYKSLQWPVHADGTDEPLLYTTRFAFPDGKARLFPVAWVGPTDPPDAEFDLHLNNGRLLEHFHEGNLTYRAAGIREKTPDTWVEVSPALAEERGLQSGTWVKLISRYGQVRVRALVRSRDGPRALHADEFHGQPVNWLTSSHTDAATNTPAYKETSVHMDVLPDIGESSLPRINFRFGHPTPQNGSRSSASGSVRTIASPAAIPSDARVGTDGSAHSIRRATARRASCCVNGWSAPGAACRGGPRRIRPVTGAARSRILRSPMRAGRERPTTREGVDGVNTPGSIRALRNLLFWQGILGSIDEMVQGLVQPFRKASRSRRQSARAGAHLTLLRRAMSRDSLAALPPVWTSSSASTSSSHPGT
jgi:formate dehydrogenase major subunit